MLENGFNSILPVKKTHTHKRIYLFKKQKKTSPKIKQTNKKSHQYLTKYIHIYCLQHYLWLLLLLLLFILSNHTS